MSENALYLEIEPRHPNSRQARISTGIRLATRDCRQEMLNAHGYHVLIAGQVSLEQYANVLRSHLFVRKALEDLCHSLGGSFVTKSFATQQEKRYPVAQYLTASRIKSALLLADLADLPCQANAAMPLPAKAKVLIDYMARVKDVFPAGLLGVLYALEETATYAGPVIARNIEQQHQLGGKAQRYLHGVAGQKADLWLLRRSLDSITDLQTQVNVVTAATISYHMYRDIIDPYASLWPRRPAKLN